MYFSHIMENINNHLIEKESMLLVSDLALAWGLSIPGTHQYIKNNHYQTKLIGARSYMPNNEARRAMEARGLAFPKNVFSIQMLKGGVGKTSIAINLALRAYMYGASVLVIDLDQQANLSFAFDIMDENIEVWVDLIENRLPINQIIHEYMSNFHIIPSNLNNSVLDKTILSGKRNVATAVSQYLEPIKDNYDLVIIDTAPNLSAINTAAACASDMVILPVIPDKFSFDGLRKTIDDLEEVRQEFEANFKNIVVFNRFDARETSSHKLLKTCLAEYGEIMSKSFVRTSSDVKNTIRTGKTVFGRKCTAKDDYDILTRELLGFA